MRDASRLTVLEYDSVVNSRRFKKPPVHLAHSLLRIHNHLCRHTLPAHIVTEKSDVGTKPQILQDNTLWICAKVVDGCRLSMTLDEGVLVVELPSLVIHGTIAHICIPIIAGDHGVDQKYRTFHVP